MLIQVTQECINLGCKGSASNCPIAIACIEALPEYFQILVTSEWISFYKKDGSYQRIDFDGLVENWIIQFDIGNPVSPFTLNIDFENGKISMENLK